MQLPSGNFNRRRMSSQGLLREHIKLHHRPTERIAVQQKETVNGVVDVNRETSEHRRWRRSPPPRLTRVLHADVADTHMRTFMRAYADVAEYVARSRSGSCERSGVGLAKFSAASRFRSDHPPRRFRTRQRQTQAVSVTLDQSRHVHPSRRPCRVRYNGIAYEPRYGELER